MATAHPVSKCYLIGCKPARSALERDLLEIVHDERNISPHLQRRILAVMQAHNMFDGDIDAVVNNHLNYRQQPASQTEWEGYEQ